jgi:hypothetical protein
MYGTFNFNYQSWIFGLTLLFLQKYCYEKKIINSIIYIEGSMCIIIIYIGIIGPLSHFDYTNFKVSLIIKIINFNEILNMAHLVIIVIFHVNVITYQIFNLSHIYHIFVENPHFLK